MKVPLRRNREGLTERQLELRKPVSSRRGGGDQGEEGGGGGRRREERGGGEHREDSGRKRGRIGREREEKRSQENVNLPQTTCELRKSFRRESDNLYSRVQNRCHIVLW